MTDCISREAARELMYHNQSPLTENDLDSIPAADVREVKRGRIEEDENTYLWCSECGCNITLASYEMPNGNLILRPNFCPNCGAKMEKS